MSADTGSKLPLLVAKSDCFRSFSTYQKRVSNSLGSLVRPLGTSCASEFACGFVVAWSPIFWLCLAGAVRSPTSTEGCLCGTSISLVWSLATFVDRRLSHTGGDYLRDRLHLSSKSKFRLVFLTSPVGKLNEFRSACEILSTPWILVWAWSSWAIRACTLWSPCSHPPFSQ